MRLNRATGVSRFSRKIFFEIFFSRQDKGLGAYGRATEIFRLAEGFSRIIAWYFCIGFQSETQSELSEPSEFLFVLIEKDKSD